MSPAWRLTALLLAFATAGGLRPCAASEAEAGAPSLTGSSQTWQFTFGGTPGTETALYAGADYRIETHLGPFTYLRGRRAGRFWRQNANGLTVPMSPGAQPREESSAAAYAASRAAKREWHLVEDRPESPVEPHAFDVPPNARVLDRLPSGISRLSLPARFVDSHVYLRANVDGRPCYLMLDSGTSDIVLDRTFVRAIGLREYARTSAVAAAPYEQAQVLARSMRIGGLELRNVAAYSVPFSYTTRGLKVVGLLGFDFFADAVVHVDYFHQRAELIDQSAFDSEQLGKAIEIPLALDDAIPIATVRIGDSAHGRFVVDTGSSNVVIFSRFARAHPGDASDAGGGATLLRLAPSNTATVVGGSLRFVPVQVKSFAFARNVFHDFIVERLVDAPAFEFENADGLVGYDFLQYFDLFFDYQNARLLLITNPWMNEVRSAPSR